MPVPASSKVSVAPPTALPVSVAPGSMLSRLLMPGEPNRRAAGAGDRAGICDGGGAACAEGFDTGQAGDGSRCVVGDGAAVDRDAPVGRRVAVGSGRRHGSGIVEIEDARIDADTGALDRGPGVIGDGGRSRNDCVEFFG